MLDAQIIRWEHILWQLDASAHLPHDFFCHIFATIEKTLGKDLHELEGKQLTKDAINSVLGLWSTPQRYVYSVETTTCNEDLLAKATVASGRFRATTRYTITYLRLH